MVEIPGITCLAPPGDLSHVAVGRLRHDAIGHYEDLITGLFDDGERDEWAGCRHPGRQAEWLGVRLCLKRLISGKHAAQPSREVVIQKNGRGRPQVIHAGTRTPVIGDCSLSHAGPWSVAAWTAREREKIGIDVERISHRLHRAAGSFVSPEDYAGPLRDRTEQLAIWWCLKEAASKALGLGLGAGLAEIRCVELEQGMHQVTHASGVNMTGWHTLFDGFAIAVCGCRTAD